jgi:hypothetical protein
MSIYADLVCDCMSIYADLVCDYMSIYADYPNDYLILQSIYASVFPSSEYTFLVCRAFLFPLYLNLLNVELQAAEAKDVRS